MLVISADLKPRYIVNQIILLALARNPAISILCVPQLSQQLREVVNFPCFCMAIAGDTSVELQPILDWCQTMVTEHHPKPSDNNKSTPLQRNLSLKPDQDIGCQSDVIMTVADLHLKKTVINARLFVPSNGKKSETPTNDFILLNDDEPQSTSNTSGARALAASIDKEIRDKLVIEIQPKQRNAEERMSKCHTPNANKIRKEQHRHPNQQYSSLTVLKTHGNQSRVQKKTINFRKK